MSKTTTCTCKKYVHTQIKCVCVCVCVCCAHTLLDEKLSVCRGDGSGWLAIIYTVHDQLT